MRKLHLVGLTTDRDGLIFTARKGSKSGGFIVPLDDRVLAAVDEARDLPNGAPAEAEPAAAGEVETVPKRLRSQSALTPREMQARLRAGRSIEEVAAEAGVDTEWVARFAVPILAEQAQVVELARSLVYAKPRLGESSQPLGASVVQNLSDRGVFIPDDVANASWSAFQLHDSVWMVRFRYRSRGRDQEAQWEIDVPAGRLMARNRHASDLGYVDPLRRRRDVEVDDQALDGEPEPAVAPPPRPRRQAGTGRAAAKAPAKRATPPAVGTRATPVKGPQPARAAGRAKRPAAPTPAKRAGGAAAAKRAAAPTPAKRPGGAAAAKRAAAPTPAKRPGRGKVAGAAKRGEGVVAVSRERAKAAPRSPSTKASASKAPATKSSATKSSASKAPASRSPATKLSATRSPATKSTGTKRSPAAPSPATAGPARSPSRRRPAKAPAPPADAGPTGGTGGVRMAVQQVSTARVAASLAAAEREPWAGVVRPRRRPDVTSSGRGAVERPRSRRPPAPAPAAAEADRERARTPRADGPEGVAPFQPRPLPAGNGQPVASRVRKVAPARPSAVPDGPPTMSLPARHVPAPAPERSSLERPKRRRLRSR